MSKASALMGPGGKPLKLAKREKQPDEDWCECDVCAKRIEYDTDCWQVREADYDVCQPCHTKALEEEKKKVQKKAGCDCILM